MHSTPPLPIQSLDRLDAERFLGLVRRCRADLHDAAPVLGFRLQLAGQVLVLETYGKFL